MGLIWYTADHEDPDCMQCENLNNGDKVCFENCGADHCWNGYRRSEYSDDFSGHLEADEYYRLAAENLMRIIGK